jgi:hypothetical protein
MHCFQSGRICEFLYENRILGIEKHVEYFIECIGITAGEEDVIILVGRDIDFFNEFKEKFV